jgi:sugar-specific transcriptional regulator TrmB
MAINNIVKHELDLRAVKLREQGNTFEKIAEILTEESNNTITYSSVYRFFESYEKTKAVIIERQEPLKVKAIEVEISTIEDRLDIIKGLKKLAESALEARDRVAAYRVATEAIDSLDKRIGKLTNNPGVTINNINAMNLSEVPTELLLRWRDEAKCLRG